MEQFTPKERADIVQLYIQNNFSIVETKRAFRKKKKLKVLLVITLFGVYTQNLLKVVVSAMLAMHLESVRAVPMKISRSYEPVLPIIQEHRVFAVLKN